MDADSGLSATHTSPPPKAATGPNPLHRLALFDAAPASRVGGRLVLPISTYPGLALTGRKVRDIVTDPRAQFESQAALHQRYGLRVVLSAMDLSAEAEAFGCDIVLTDHEIPSVVGRRVTTLEQVQELPVPQPGDGRTGVYLETVRQLKRLAGAPVVLGGCIGPFSLAARLVGVSEALELTLSDPELVEAALEKSTEFLRAYAAAFKAAGADGLIMAEPAAGLLSPRGMSRFSSPFVRQIAAAVAHPGMDGFAFVLHNCAAKLAHLPALLETGLNTFHFGSPMNLPEALTKVGAEVVLCGNLDPTAVFCQGSPETVVRKRNELLASTEGFQNLVVSSGCDLPPGTPLAALDALYQAPYP